jgi:HAD superfamily hydrolase (TIGR01509 family)
VSWWARVESNHRPLACEANALPLSHAPDRRISLAQAFVPTIQAVIFDCDGTLVDSLPIVRDVLHDYLSTLDLAVPVAEATMLFGSGRLGDSVAALETRNGKPLPADFVEELLRRRDASIRDRLRAMEGAVELLDALSMPVAVASNAPLPQTMLSLEVTGLLEYFAPHVYSAHDVGWWKPHPGLFLHAAAQLGVPPQACAVVEDSPLGVEAALAAGMTVYLLADDAGCAGAQVIRCLADLPDHVRGTA